MDSYCIWGTGKIAQSLIITIEEYTNIYKLLGDNLTGKLEYFIDSNKDKYTQKLYDKEIKSPQMYFDDNDYLCECP